MKDSGRTADGRANNAHEFQDRTDAGGTLVPGSMEGRRESGRPKGKKASPGDSNPGQPWVLVERKHRTINEY